MATLLVAVYAAVVSTASLGWRVYRWRSGRAGILNLTVGFSWLSDGSASVSASVLNFNDYPVKVTHVLVLSYWWETRAAALARSAQPSMIRKTDFSKPELSTDMVWINYVVPVEVPAHDGVSLQWTQEELAAINGEPIIFEPGGELGVQVVTSLYRRVYAMGYVPRQHGLIAGGKPRKRIHKSTLWSRLTDRIRV